MSIFSSNQFVCVISCSLLLMLLWFQNSMTHHDDPQERFLEDLFKLKIEIFYSPTGSKILNFFQMQLAAVIQSVLGQYISIKLYPVANCKIDEKARVGDGKAGSKFVCAKGHDEEEASLHHLCAYDILMAMKEKTLLNRNKLKNLTMDAIAYIVCTLAESAIPLIANTKACVKLAKGLMNHIDKCVIQREDNLITAAIARLKEVNRTYSPFFVFNGRQDKKKDQGSQNFFWKIVCGILGKGGPKECLNATNQTSNGFDDFEEPESSTEIITTTPSTGVYYVLFPPCLLVMFLTALLSELT